MVTAHGVIMNLRDMLDTAPRTSAAPAKVDSEINNCVVRVRCTLCSVRVQMLCTCFVELSNVFHSFAVALSLLRSPSVELSGPAERGKPKKKPHEIKTKVAPRVGNNS